MASPRALISAKAQVFVCSDVVGESTTGKNVVLNTVARTFTIPSALNLSINGLTLYSSIYDYFLANSAALAGIPFPFNPVNNLSLQLIIGQDGSGNNNGWAPADAATRKSIAGVGWVQYNSSGTITEQWFGVLTTTGGILSTDQCYYQLASTDAPTNFSTTGPVFEPVQVVNNTGTGNFIKTSYFSLNVRPQGRTFSGANLGTVFRSSTAGGYAQALGITTSVDTNVSLADSVLAAAPYTSLTLTYYAANQNFTINGNSAPFNIVIDNSVAQLSLVQIYQWMQYQNRQITNINQGTTPNNSTVIGSTAATLVGSYAGGVLTTATGVYIKGVLSSDTNNIQFTDVNSVVRTNPLTNVITANVPSGLQALTGLNGTAKYFAYVAGTYGTSSPVLLQDASGTNVTGNYTGQSSITFTCSYSNNTQGGRSGSTPIGIDFVVIAPGAAKYSNTAYTITAQSIQSFSVNYNSDPFYSLT